MYVNRRFNFYIIIVYSVLFKIFSAHQCHYEQMGKLAATLTVNGTEHKLKMDAFRDHSFGKIN